MTYLSPNRKYSMHELAENLKLSTLLANALREKFGDPISIKELKQISSQEFFSCKYLGRKRWYEFQQALSSYDFPERSVTFIRKNGLKNLIVEIDISKPFEKVIQDLAIVIKNSV